jgi:lysophospholipase L1-like esterase
MSLIPKANISSGNTILASDVLNIIEALDGTTARDIALTGSIKLPVCLGDPNVLEISGVDGNIIYNSVAKTLYQHNGTTWQLFHNFALNHYSRIYTLGDSETASGYYQSKLSLLLPSTWKIVNNGIAGNNTTQMLARLSSDILNIGDAEYVIVMGGINDVYQDVSAATIESNLQTIYTAIHATGAKVVALTLTPSQYCSAPRQAVVDAVKTWILNTATNVDYRINAYTLLEDPSAANNLLATYDSGDHIHFNQAGGNALGQAVYDAVVWTTSLSIPIVEILKSLSLNQSLLTTSSPIFLAMLLLSYLTTNTGIKIFRNGSETLGDGVIFIGEADETPLWAVRLRNYATGYNSIVIDRYSGSTWTKVFELDRISGALTLAAGVTFAGMTGTEGRTVKLHADGSLYAE